MDCEGNGSSRDTLPNSDIQPARGLVPDAVSNANLPPSSLLGSRNGSPVLWMAWAMSSSSCGDSGDLYPITTRKELCNPKHHYSKKLARIRVTDHVKDLGKIDLTRP